MLYYPQGPRRPLISPPVTASRERMVAAPPILIHPGAVDSCGLRGFSRPDAPLPAMLHLGPLGMKKERRSPRRPFPVKICENSCPSSRRPCPLSLDIPGFSHVLPSCPALSRLSQLSCLFTLVNHREKGFPRFILIGTGVCEDSVHPPVAGIQRLDDLCLDLLGRLLIRPPTISS